MLRKLVLTNNSPTWVSYHTNENKSCKYFPPAATIVPAPLKLIQIYFDTATYDEVERDVKVTLEAQLGLIGGTMGLLTGFSIVSGVEFVYFSIKFFMPRLR